MTKKPGINERKEWAIEQRRERILEKTKILLENDTIDKITLETVARESGYTVQNLYIYFRDKEDLFAALLLKELNSLLSVEEKHFNRAVSGLQKLYAMNQFVIFFLKKPKYFDLYLRFEKTHYKYYKHTDHRHHRDFLKQCKEVTDKMTELIINAINIGIKDGSIKTTLDPQHLQLHLWAQALGVIQVTMMREKYFSIGYNKLTKKKFLATFRSLVERNLTSIVS